MNNSSPAIYGHDLFGDAIQPPSRGILADRFISPPFTVLNAREGFWQDRKRAWVGLGIESEVGHGNDPRNSPGGDPRPACDYFNRERGSGNGRALSASSFNVGGWMEDNAEGTRGNENGTSIFDPVLTELMYRWFCPPGGQIVDPFAGGSVRGIVAAVLGRKYWGCDLSANQIAANEIQAAAIVPNARPQWVVGDTREQLPAAPDADFVFGCPPYGDLEVYSDDPRDLSAMSASDFDIAYADIIAAACSRLKPNRFAAFVVGEYRDKAGNYRRFVPNTIAAFMSAGLHFYNEAILVTCVGSLPIRVTNQFRASRKLGKTHQNILVFVKGDAFKAAKGCENETA